MDQSQIQALLEDLFEPEDEFEYKVYFQPPNNLQMEHPAIVYERNGEEAKFAGNLPYNRVWEYSLTVIDRDPESRILEKVTALPMCTFDRHYVVENLHHDVFRIYF